MDVTSIDFNKYDDILASSSTDNTIRLFDLKKNNIWIKTILGHSLTIKKIKFSPYYKNILSSCSM